MSAEPFVVSAMGAVGRRDVQVMEHMLDTSPALVVARIKRAEECFLDDCGAQVYEGDTLLQAASFTHNAALARRLVESGADVHARNRRGAEPLHAATSGGPGSKNGIRRNKANSSPILWLRVLIRMRVRLAG
jgi:Ankyrin repeats (many copies)